MKVSKEINELVNAYCRLRDRQYAVYSRCAKRHGLTTNELFVLDILWFAPEGCTQTAICERLSANKQTIAAIITRFRKKGYVADEEVSEDRDKNGLPDEDGIPKGIGIPEIPVTE